MRRAGDLFQTTLMKLMFYQQDSCFTCTVCVCRTKSKEFTFGVSGSMHFRSALPDYHSMGSESARLTHIQTSWLNSCEKHAFLEPAETHIARTVFFSAMLACVCVHACACVRVVVHSQEIPDNIDIAEGKTDYHWLTHCTSVSVNLWVPQRLKTVQRLTGRIVYMMDGCP